MATEIAKSTVLCNLTDDWQSRLITGPRNNGGTLRYRFFVIANKFGWALSEERDGSVPTAHVHAASFALLACTFKSHVKMDPVECLQRVAAGLTKITGKAFTFAQSKKTGAELWVDMGRQLDEAFKTNYAADDDVRKNLFGFEGEDED